MGRAVSRFNTSKPIAVLLALSLGACVASLDQRGNLPEQEKLAQIQPGSTTRDQVVKILGTPSSTGVFNDKLRADGYWVFAGGLADTDAATRCGIRLSAV